MQPHQIATSIYTGLFVVSIVLPLWWITTRSYRASLPEDEIMKLQQTRTTIFSNVSLVIDPQFKVSHSQLSDMMTLINEEFKSCQSPHIEIVANIKDISKAELNEIIDNFTKFHSQCDTETTSEPKAFKYQVILTKADVLKSVDKQQKYVFHPEIGLIVQTPDFMIAKISNLVVNSILATHFSSLCDLKDPQFEKETFPVPVINAKSYNISERITPNEQIVSFTLAIADPHSMNVKWNAGNMLESYLEPYLESIKPLINIKIQSHVQYFADFELTKKKLGSGFVVAKDYLPLMINPLESRFNNYVTKSQILHYVVYVPSPKDSPLTIEDGDDRFMVEGWGGLWIYKHALPLNESKATKQHNIYIDSKDVASKFLPMIDRHYGFQSNHDLTSCNQIKIPLHIINNRAASACINLFNSTLNTIVSLSRLMTNIENMVIRDDIKDLIVESIEQLQHAQYYLQNGDIMTSLNHIKDANKLSEKAFYDPSLLALLYFPSDEKYAIYIPLFLPISLPIIVSLYKTFKFWLSG